MKNQHTEQKTLIEAPKKKPRKYYIDPKEFDAEIQKSFDQDQLTLRVLEMFDLMIKKIQGPFKYEYEPDDRIDVAQGALLVILEKWRGFDRTRKNPFAFYTRVIYNALFASFNELQKTRRDTISLSSIFEEDI